jgi:exodeoxyribonuclease VII small subunit
MSDINSNADNNQNNTVSVEQSLKRLDEIARLLENQNTDLKTSLALYSEAVNLIDSCKNYLTDVEKEIIMLSGTEAAE